MSVITALLPAAFCEPFGVEGPQWLKWADKKEKLKMGLIEVWKKTKQVSGRSSLQTRFDLKHLFSKLAKSISSTCELVRNANSWAPLWLRIPGDRAQKTVFKALQDETIKLLEENTGSKLERQH